MTEAGKQMQREYKRQWQRMNPEKVRGYQRKWRKANAEKNKLYQERYWDKKAAEAAAAAEDPQA